MTTRIITTLVLVAVCATPVPLLASDVVEINVFGIDTDLSCGKYLKDISTSTGTEKGYSWWVAGFVTGTNLEKGRAISTDNAGHNAWLKAYCEAHPLELFIDAAMGLNKELDKKKIGP